MFQNAAETIKETAEQVGDQAPDVQLGGDGPVIGHGLLDTINNIWHYEFLTVNGQPVEIANILIALLVLAIGYLLARVISAIVGKRWLPRLHLQQAAVHTIQRLLFYLMLTIVVLFALQFAGVPLTALTFLGGAIALGIGFGSQNVINNFISGLILLIERPIKVGELVTVDDLTGTILSIGARATLIHSYMGATYIVPNSKILQNSVTNWYRPEHRLKSIVGVGVAYGSDTGKVRGLLEKAMNEQKLVSESKDNRIMFVGFGGSSLDFEVHCWITPRNVLERKSHESDLRFRIDELFRDHGIEIPFPQQDMNFRGDKPLHVVMSRDEETDGA